MILNNRRHQCRKKLKAVYAHPCAGKDKVCRELYTYSVSLVFIAYYSHICYSIYGDDESRQR